MTKLLFLLAALMLSSAAVQAQAPAPAGNAENGKKLFLKNNCYSCHGYDGHGGAGVKLAPKPIAVQAFIAIVRRPPGSNMPTFSAKVIPDADLRDMWAYLNSIPAAPAVKDVSLLNAIQ
ncbi:MAG TPA: cytochrome c [Bryobacteraceae bacterium]|nr:cytochrome c [Bryobacteraceae bacterium]